MPALKEVLEERLSLMAPARRLRLALADKYLRAFAAGRPLRVLDAGCGDGLLTLALAKRHPGWSFLGIDLRDDMLQGARERAKGRGVGNVEFRPADLTRPLGLEDFDCALALECLSEIPEDELALRTIAAALAPGGLLCAQVPEQGWTPVLPGSAKTWREQVRQGYRPGRIREMMTGAGVAEPEITPTFHVPVALAQEISDRIKRLPVGVRAAAFPLLASAVWLEAHGLSAGRASALFARGVREGSPAHRT